MEVQLQKVIRLNQLLDLYGQLLTPKQYDYMDRYYGDNLSLAEIATEANVSRAAVHDQLKRGEHQLEGYESKLQLAAKAKQRGQYYDQIEQILADEAYEALVKIMKQLNQFEGRE
ncbi:MAG: YlxM family DNA-binding protein [Culicoidibacterales bacterium]